MVASDIPDLAPIVNDALNDYAWFLEQTAKSKKDLQEILTEPDSRRAMLARAQSYTERLFEIIRQIDQQGDRTFLRSLVV
jgi:flagellum-specific peptidoglycan hydrolase FlgJ